VSWISFGIGFAAGMCTVFGWVMLDNFMEMRRWRK
jgi:hypothetical protein